MFFGARIKLAASSGSLLFSVLWYGAATLLVILAPTQIWRGQPFWLLPPDELLQTLAPGLAFLAFALFLQFAATPPHRLGIVTFTTAAVTCFGSVALAMTMRDDLPFSRASFMIGSGLGAVLALVPYLIDRTRRLALAGSAIAMTALLTMGVVQSITDDEVQTSQLSKSTALYVLDVHYFGNLVARPLPVDGGAITAAADGFLLATGAGDFYRLNWNTSDGRLTATRLPIPPPLNRITYLQDQPDPKSAPRLRVTDVLLDTTTRPVRLLVAHQYWNAPGKCFTLRVSSIPLRDTAALEPRTGAEWRTLFDSQPCLSISPSFDDTETGGRLAQDSGGNLLLTIGDHGFDGIIGDSFAQDPAVDYGKIWMIADEGPAQIYSLGHRNPQGLTIDDDGRVWSTEHGPQGGDEINLIVANANYGWPLASYGTDYGLDYWPLAKLARDHGAFNEPAYAFVPSVAISNLIAVHGEQFPRWNGDLLVGSLRGQSLFRVRTRADRVLYVEPIVLDRRIRDLAEGSDGRIVLWTDEGDLLSISRATRKPTGQAIYVSRCSGCHEIPQGGTVRAAPDLRRVIGRKVASLSGYDYSIALQGAGGAWSRTRLDEFLRNPADFAPGNRMQAAAVTDPAERELLLDYLAGLD